MGSTPCTGIGTGDENAQNGRRPFMIGKHAYCSWCGTPFAPHQPWPRHCTHCANTSYLNPLPVAVVLVPVTSGVLLIRRNTEPQKGTLTLPGGYIDAGETWQAAACREVLEETGISLHCAGIRLYDVENGLDNTLVLFGLAPELPDSAVHPFSSPETEELVVIDAPVELGFSMHTRVVARYFAERKQPSCRQLSMLPPA
jgi:8-oxo-dGTP pyrophosphatase MutT (NUDIX family)